ncbi:MAG TPA: helix-turn-helix transcriptional regulator [Nocardioides sp.]|nr:helix-turn-helix transcriptional regulator [Nocardioides sp.]
MQVDSPERAASPAAVARRVLSRLRSRFSCDGGALVLMDPVTGLFTTGAVDSLPVATCHPFFRTETEDGARTLRALAASERPASAVAAAEQPDDPLVRQVLRPFGYAAELRAVFRDARVAWGGVSLWRRDGRPPFTVTDVAALEAVSEGIGRELRSAVLGSLDPPSATAEPASTGVVVVADGAWVEASEGLDTVLQELGDPEQEEYRHLEHLAALAARDGRFSTVIRTSRGWLAAHGTPLSEGRVAIALTAADPARLFGARAAAAGLSARELEVTRLLCRGHSDRQIARLLGISEHTAHDHVRAVRRKLGVRSRSEVSGLIFAEAYFDDFLATAALSHGD